MKQRYLIQIGLLAVLVLSVGCSTHQSHYAKPDPQVLESAFSGNLIAGQPSAVAAADTNPFELTPEMRDFVSHYAPQEYHDKYKAGALVRALTTAYGLNMKYRADITHSAAEAFARREANCLSFTMLLYALAKEAGLAISFNEVEVPPVWDLQGNALIYYKHVNAVVDIRWAESKIVDINMENYNEAYRQKRITKDHALVLYFNNKAVEALSDNRLADAQLYFMRALDIEADFGFVLGNMATLYRRVERFDVAQELYLRALEVDGFDPVVASNLARNYRSLGDESLAKQLELEVANHREKNPYYHFALAKTEYDSGDNETAITEVNKAIKLYPRDHRFYFLKAKVLSRLGADADVERSLKLARSYSSDDLEKQRYSEKINKVSAILAYQSDHPTE